jgi:hypothetical protein
LAIGYFLLNFYASLPALACSQAARTTAYAFSENSNSGSMHWRFASAASSNPALVDPVSREG